MFAIKRANNGRIWTSGKELEELQRLPLSEQPAVHDHLREFFQGHEWKANQKESPTQYFPLVLWSGWEFQFIALGLSPPKNKPHKYVVFNKVAGALAEK